MNECARFLQLALALVVTLISINADDISSSVQVNAAYDELYADALRLYYKDDWENAILKFEAAITDWKNEGKFTLVCRNECKKGFDARYGERRELFSIQYLRYINYMRNCSHACMERNMGRRLKVSKHIFRLFEDRVPYSFMQYAYHKNGNNRMGIQAASTNLRFNSKDDQMHGNMKYYSGLPELQDVIVDEIESLAPIEHHELYEKGRKAYNAKNWEKSVEFFEASIKEYVKTYEECKTLCEVDVEERQQYIQGGIYGYHMQLLLCTLDCPRKLSMLLNHPQSNFLSKQFDFLHYSYVQLDRLESALMCAMTNLLLNPLNKHMHDNMKYYEKNGYNITDAQLREDGKYLFEDAKSQMELLLEIKSYLLDLDEEYKGSEYLADTTYENYMKHGLFTDEPLPEEKKPEKTQAEKDKEEEFKREPYKRFPPPTKDHIEKFLHDSEDLKGISLTMMEQQLNGSYRAVFDGLASDEECKKLANLGMTMGHAGDGYANDPSPHTVKEEFLGVNVNNATWAAAKGDVSLEKAELYVNLSEKVRVITEAYFRLSTPLYFSYTHLVCRKALEQSPKGMHISHPIHSDNCVLKKDGEIVTCLKEHPAYTWRDYSAILYLNDDFTGGQFIFARKNHTVEAIVKPKCGRMVAFSAGFENLHGVLGIKEGTRCALPIWFTLDKRYDEKQRDDAVVVLENLRKERKSEANQNKDGHKEL
ncbi:prolyl 3-hydroxylase 2-like [Dendronephthya gigantea]|uniref:prolyl 3-hydroxylase 2-like n=1 Tax=Dendronephthya gigantea TaxID=151771 RepID=UPI00106C6547|nr:prolyl 3-hydroxylase 2-like [Dendronephthya gigantea]